MVGSVPIADGRMVSPQRDFKVVIVVVSNDRTLDFRCVTGRLGSKGRLAKIANLRGERGREMQIKLTESEAAGGPFLVRCGKIDVAKAVNLQRGVVNLCLLNRN